MQTSRRSTHDIVEIIERPKKPEGIIPGAMLQTKSNKHKTEAYINTKVVKVLRTPVGGQGLWTLTQKMRHFDKTVTDLILHFLRFGALKKLTGYYFVLIICFIHFSIFPVLFPWHIFPINTAYFPHSFVHCGVQMTYG